MRDPSREFQRTETTRRVANALMFIGLVASLVMAFPMMIGLSSALANGVTLFFFVPLVACFFLARLWVFLRR